MGTRHMDSSMMVPLYLSIPSSCCVGISQHPVCCMGVPPYPVPVLLVFLTTQWLLCCYSSARSACCVGIPQNPVVVVLAFLSIQWLLYRCFSAPIACFIGVPQHPMAVVLATISTQCLPNVLAFLLSSFAHRMNMRELSILHLIASQYDIISNHTLFPFP